MLDKLFGITSMLRYLRGLEPSEKTWNSSPWEELMLDKVFFKTISSNAQTPRLGFQSKFLYQLARVVTMEHVIFEHIVDQHISLMGQNAMACISNATATQDLRWEFNMALECPDLPLIVVQYPDCDY